MSIKRTSAVGKVLLPVAVVERRIYRIRGQNVMLAADLAEIYRI